MADAGDEGGVAMQPPGIRPQPQRQSKRPQIGKQQSTMATKQNPPIPPGSRSQQLAAPPQSGPSDRRVPQHGEAASGQRQGPAAPIEEESSARGDAPHVRFAAEADEARVTACLREALPVARDLLNSVIVRLPELGLPEEVGEQDAAPLFERLGEVGDQGWEQLLQSCGLSSDPVAMQAATRLRAWLTAAEQSPAPTAEQVRNSLERLRDAIDKAIDSGESVVSDDHLTELIEAVLQIATLVGIGILAAAAAAAAAGVAVLAALLPAAVGLLVSALCEKGVQTVRAALHKPTYAETLRCAQDRLLRTTGDVRDLLWSVGESPSPDGDRCHELAKRLHPAAVMYAIQVQDLVKGSSWGAASGRYLNAVEDLVRALHEVPEYGGRTQADRRSIVERLNEARSALSDSDIPVDLQPSPSAEPSPDTEPTDRPGAAPGHSTRPGSGDSEAEKAVAVFYANVQRAREIAATLTVLTAKVNDLLGATDSVFQGSGQPERRAALDALSEAIGHQTALIETLRQYASILNSTVGKLGFPPVG